jgi:hypothetical protein
MRAFLLLIFIIELTNASMKFRENRYISALDRNIELKGELSIKNDILSINYTSTNESIIYHKDSVSIDNSMGKRVIPYSENKNIKYIGLFIKNIIKNDYNTISQVFTLKEIKDELKLTPKEAIKHIIESIKISKNGDKIKHIVIYLKNGDKIKIETIN